MKVIRRALPSGVKRFIKNHLGGSVGLTQQREHEILMLNNKMLSYEATRHRIADLRESANNHYEHPGFVGLNGKIPTQADIEAPWYGYWCQQMRETPVYHRKIWEFAYALQVLSEQGMLVPGKRAVGFGCGTEPIASVLTKHGVEVTITDQATETASDGRWSTSGQHSATIDAAHRPEIVDRETFYGLATFQTADMNDLKNELRCFDFCWSLCAFEHLGSLQKGLDFVANSMRVLRPGGIALHTTELNTGNTPDTLETDVLVLYQEHHFEQLAARLTADGHQMCERNYSPGDGLIDNLFDLPPFALHTDHWLHSMRPTGGGEYDEPHLKLAVGGYPTTSFGFWARAGS